MSDEPKRPPLPLSKEQLRIAAQAREFLAKTAQPVADAAAAVQSDYLRSLVTGLSTSLPKMDEVIRQSVASGADLRASLPDVGASRSVPMTPYKSGTEYAIEGVQREVIRLTKIAASMADNTGANAELAKAAVQQSIALVGALDDLHSTTRQGIAAGEKRDGVIVRLTWVLIGASVLLVLLTGAIVYLTWVLVLHEAG